MNTKIKTALAIIGAAMTAVSVTGITVTLTRQADPADPAPTPPRIEISHTSHGR